MYLSAMVFGRAGADSPQDGTPIVRVLILAASPTSLERIRIDHEVRGIEEKLLGSKHRSSVRVVVRWAVRVDDLLQALLAEQPEVVHFSGHGTDEGEIILEDKDGSPLPIGKEPFASLFGVLKDRVRVVVLNACHSRDQAEAVAKHVDCAIGTNDAMPDGAAIVFAAAFYQAIGFGRSVQTAFDLGVSALKLTGVGGASVPELLPREGVIPNELVLVQPERSSGVKAAPMLARLVNVPELPPNFLARGSDLARLKALVVGGVAKAVGLTGRTIRTGVHGMGGIGKSVLAAWLARDEDVQRAFPDGIFWVTLGRDPKLTLLQAELCAWLGDPGAAFENEHRGRARLTELLRDRDLRSLVIIDDVWEARHAAAFGELGPSGRLLITTRDAELLVTIGAEPCSLDVLPVKQALALLAGRSGEPVEALPAEAREVAKECGYLPLALAMIGAMVRGRPDRWGDALEALRAADLEAIGRDFPEYPYPDLLRAIEVSLEALTPWDRERYLDFAMFAEDTPVPEAVLQTLWRAEGLDARKVRALVYRFVDRSLLSRDEGRRLRLHDLQYDYVRKRAGDISHLHRRLVDGYSAACQGEFASGPDDGYFFQHLGEHLVGAGRGEELRRLLVDFDWLRAKLLATDPAALLGDYGLVKGGEAERLVEGALRLSAHVLAFDKRQLAPQLLGRLRDEEAGEMEVLLGSAARSFAGPCLKPRTASLTRPGGALRCTLAGHSAVVSAVAVTPDGRYAVSGSLDTTLRVWELSTSREVRALMGHLRWILAVVVTPDGRHAISASSDRTLKVWELSTGREVRALAGHLKRVNAVAVTPDGRYAISGSSDATLKVWELSTGRELHTLAGHSSWVRAVAVTPDGRYAVSGSNDTTLKVWELSTGREVRALEGHRREVRAVAVTPDGCYAVSGSHDRTLKVWELSTGRELRVFAGHSTWVRAVAVTPDGRCAVSGSDDKILKVWELATGREVRELAGHSNVVQAVVVTRDGRYAVSGSSDATLRVWELSTSREVRALAAPSNWVNAIAVTPDGRYMVSGSADRTLKVGELSTGRKVRVLAGHSSEVFGVAITPDSRYAVSASSDTTLKVWDLSTGQEVRVLAGHSDWVRAVAVTPDGRYAVSGSDDRTLKVWELSTGLAVRVLMGHSSWINTVAVTPDGRYAVSGSHDCMLKLWELSSGLEVRELAVHSSRINAVAVMPDGRYVISASSDKTLKVCELSTGHEVRALVGHSSEVRGVAVTPDGRCAVSSSYDKTLKVWDIDTGTALTTFYGESSFYSVAVAPDGRTVIAGDELGRAHVFFVEGLPQT